MTRLAVTTSYKPTDAQVARARSVAAQISAPYSIRSGRLDAMFESLGVDLIYVVTKIREELRSRTEHIFVNPGLIKLKRFDGAAHPLIRAVAPPEGPAVDRVVDATIGLASDAVQLAWVLDVQVEGIESSPAICCLLEEGLVRMGRLSQRWSEVTGRISVKEGRAVDRLAELPEGSRPVVFFDPMFERPLEAVPGFDVFRRVAEHAPLDVPTLEQAIRVAAHRVVVKVPHGARPTAEAEPGFNRRVCGRAVDYVIVEKVLPDPVWERRRLPTGAY